MKKLKRYASFVLGLSLLFGSRLQTAATQGSTPPKNLSTKEKVAIAAGAIVGIPLVGFAADKLSYELCKSENGIDMRAITKRGYNNKKVKKVADLKTGEEKADYLIDKWSRTVAIDLKGFPCYGYYFKGEKPCNRIPIYFATSLPTIKNADALTEDDLISGYSGLSNHTPQALTEDQKNEVKNAFRRSGLLQPKNFETPHVFEERDPLHAPNAPFYLAPGEENKFKWKPDNEPEQYLYDLLAFCICDAPDEKYFELYYYKDQWGFLRPYERFNYDAWVTDNFPGKTIDEVAQKCTEIFKKYGANTWYKFGYPVWHLENNFNLKQAEQDIKEWKSQCRN